MGASGTKWRAKGKNPDPLLFCLLKFSLSLPHYLKVWNRLKKLANILSRRREAITQGHIMHHQQKAHPNDLYANIYSQFSQNQYNLGADTLNLFSCISFVVHTTFSSVVIQKLGNMMREIKAEPRVLQVTWTIWDDSPHAPYPPPYFYQMNDQVVDVAYSTGSCYLTFHNNLFAKRDQGKGNNNFIMYISVNLELSDCFID